MHIIDRIARSCRGLTITCLLLLASQHLAWSQSESALTPALAEARVAALLDGGAAEDSEAVATYNAARELLVGAEKHEQETQQYLDALTNAPRRRAEIQSRIEVLEEEEAAVIPAGLEREALDARLIITRAELNETSGMLEALNRHLAARESSASDIRARLAEIQAQSGVPSSPVVDAAATPSLAEAQAWRDAAAYRALAAERKALSARLDSQAQRYDIMALERAEQELQQRVFSDRARALEQALSGQIAEAVDAASAGIDPEDPAFELAMELADGDAQLRSERIDLDRRLADIRREVARVEDLARALEERASTAHRVVQFAGESEALGGVLLAYWGEIDNFTIEDPTRNLSGKMGAAIVNRIGMEESLQSLTSATKYVDRRLGEMGIPRGQSKQRSRAALIEMSRAYRERLRSTIKAESEYIEALGTLDDTFRSLKAKLTGYEKFLKGLILWIPAFPPLWEVNLSDLRIEAQSLAGFAATVRLSAPALLLLALVLSLALRAWRPHFRTVQATHDAKVARPRDDHIVHTAMSMGCVALRALPTPLAVAGLAWSINHPTLAGSLGVFAVVLFLFKVIRLGSEEEGLHRRHFGWSQEGCAAMRRSASRLIRLWLPLALVVAVLATASGDTGGAFMTRLGILILAVVTIMATALVVISSRQETGRDWLRARGSMLRIGLMLAALYTGIAASIGHLFSITALFASLVDTLLWIVPLLYLRAFLLRWVQVTRRRLRLAELLNARKEGDAEDDAALEEDVARVSDVSAASSEFIKVGFYVISGLVLFSIWQPLLPAFDILKDVTLWTSTTVVDGQSVENRISLAMLLLVAILAALTLYAARKLPALIDLALRNREEISASARYTVSTLLNYTIIGGGAIAALGALGLQWSQLQWLVAALGVGIGFGLQEIIANFISGLIILFERPIRIGDIVTTGAQDGIVTKIRIRATTIRDWDGKELLVPNKEFITGRLTNWSLSDPRIRIVLPVGIAYGANVELAIQTLMEIVQAHTRVLEDPEPQIVFESFGDNALILSARAHLDSVENRMGVVTELNTTINRRFEELGIVIAFPQRDIHFDSDKPLRISLEQPGNPS